MKWLRPTTRDGLAKLTELYQPIVQLGLTLSSKKPTDDQDWISQAEAARIRGVSRQAIHSLVARGKLETREIGGRTLVRRIEIIEHLPEPPGRLSANDIEAASLELISLIEKQPIVVQREVQRRLRQMLKPHPLEEEFGVDAEIILEAISRSSDLSKRGVRGLIAEAHFKMTVLDRLQQWNCSSPEGNAGYDFVIESESDHITIQVKMQRQKQGKPMMASEAYRRFSGSLYVVETQRTRAGTDKRHGGQTRPYRFGEFDILAVSMAPSTGDWSQFRYSVANWLIPQDDEPDQILKFQPVSIEPNNDWCSDLETCIEWWRRHETRTISS